MDPDMMSMDEASSSDEAASNSEGMLRTCMPFSHYSIPRGNPGNNSRHFHTWIVLTPDLPRQRGKAWGMGSVKVCQGSRGVKKKRNKYDQPLSSFFIK